MNCKHTMNPEYSDSPEVENFLCRFTPTPLSEEMRHELQFGKTKKKPASTYIIFLLKKIPLAAVACIALIAGTYVWFNSVGEHSVRETRVLAAIIEDYTLISYRQRLTKGKLIDTERMFEGMEGPQIWKYNGNSISLFQSCRFCFQRGL